MKKLNQKQGFTLAELMIAAFILVISFSGVLFSYVRSLYLSEISRNQTLATLAVKSRVENIRNTPFAQIINTYNNATFTVSNINGRGVSYVSAVNTDLLKVTVSFCWRQKDKRVFGEDLNLNGVLDAGEEKSVPANNMIDSPVTVVTYIYKT